MSPGPERALYLMLCDKELRRLDPLGNIFSERWSLRTVEELIADGKRHYSFRQAPKAARDRLLNMATEYKMSSAGMCMCAASTYIAAFKWSMAVCHIQRGPWLINTNGLYVCLVLLKQRIVNAVTATCIP
jgi:hypothetical protein